MNNRDDYDTELLTAAATEAQLVWNRYGAMLVVHTIVVSAIGILMFQNPSHEKESLVACFLAVILTVPWWVLTTVGWSLEYSLLDAISEKTKDNSRRPFFAFLRWGRSTGICKGQDKIWWSAHCVIAIFYLAYVALGAYAAVALGAGKIPAIILSVLLFGAGCWWGFSWSLRQPSLWTPNERPASGNAMKAYLLVSGVLFSVVALIHVIRALDQWAAQVGTWTVPLWISWVAFVVSGVLAAWAFMLILCEGERGPAEKPQGKPS